MKNLTESAERQNRDLTQSETIQFASLDDNNWEATVKRGFRFPTFRRKYFEEVSTAYAAGVAIYIIRVTGSLRDDARHYRLRR